MVETVSLAEVERAILYQKRNKIRTYYPDSGPLRREAYPKHQEFFSAGSTHGERLMIAANRVGKTEGVGAYETALHLTGRYPTWWTGRRFSHPIKSWAAGDTSKTVREILQEKLLGQVGQWGTGMIPADCIVGDPKRKQGIPDAVEIIYVRHVSGGTSVLVLKSYDQRRESFQGTEQDWIWLDEEPPEDVYTECVMRTMAAGAFKGGAIALTFTPVNGWTAVVEKFLNDEECRKAGRFVVTATWDDAPHLSQAEKDRLFATLPPHQRDARAKGIPALGSGAIYPVTEDSIACDPFAIPPHWPRCYGLDVGWNRTAAVWGAHDRDNDVLYLYAQHYYAHSEVGENARAIRGRGSWIPGVIDPAARGRSQKDGEQMLQAYREHGLDVNPAINAREAGIYAVWQRMLSGRLKVFRSLGDWWAEFRKYRRDERGLVVKEADHLMDATRYLEMSGRERMITEPGPEEADDYGYTGRSDGWMS